MSSLLTKPIVRHHLSRVSPIQLRDFPLHYNSGKNESKISGAREGNDKEPSCFGKLRI